MSQSSPPRSYNSLDKSNESTSEPLDNPKNVCDVLNAEGINESPIDINISHVIPVTRAPQLAWINHELPPKKMKITNTGHTVIMSGKWGQERPYITSGVLQGKYVFSQMHVHWGVNDMEGSEHMIDGSQFPGEMHVVMFKSCYLTQESALKEKDGVAILVYIITLQEPPNPDFQLIVDALPGIAKAHTSAKIPPTPLNKLIRQFSTDYFMYQGSVTTTECVHQILWLITRIPIGASSDQMDSLRFLLDNDDNLIRRNFRPVQPINDRHVFHILPSTSKYSTLLPIPVLDIGEKAITQIYQLQVLYSRQMKYIHQKVISYEKKRQLQSSENIKKSYEDTNIADRTMSLISKISKYMDCIYYIVSL